jgi:hypothetical protein
MSNPFAMPDSNSLPVMETRSIVRLKRVGVMSAGMASGALGAACGLLAGVFVSFMTLVILSSGPQANAPGLSTIGGGFVGIILGPIVYGLVGFVGGVINAIIYNILAGMTGGLQMEFSRD